jgi:hypothetical protein
MFPTLKSALQFASLWRLFHVVGMPHKREGSQHPAPPGKGQGSSRGPPKDAQSCSITRDRRCKCADGQDAPNIRAVLLELLQHELDIVLLTMAVEVDEEDVLPRLPVRNRSAIQQQGRHGARGGTHLRLGRTGLDSCKVDRMLLDDVEDLVERPNAVRDVENKHCLVVACWLRLW